MVVSSEGLGVVFNRRGQSYAWGKLIREPMANKQWFPSSSYFCFLPITLYVCPWYMCTPAPHLPGVLMCVCGWLSKTTGKMLDHLSKSRKNPKTH